MPPKPIKVQPNYLRLLSWNANGIKTKLNEFREIIKRFNIDVAFINETHLKPGTRANVPNYICYRNDRLHGRGGGTAIYVKKHINHYSILTPEEVKLEITMIKVITTRGEILLAACYNPPSETPVFRDYSVIESLSNKIILTGDFNSKHPEWHSIRTNQNGRRLKHYMEALDFQINAPTSPTHFPGTTDHVADVLDLVIFKNVTISPTIEVLNELSSDHLPILFSWGSGREENHLKMVHYRTSWKQFGEHLKDFKFPIHTQDLNEKSLFLENQIKEALALATTTRQASECVHDLPQDIMDLIRARRKAIKNYNRTFSPQHKAEKNYLNQLVRNSLDNLNNLKWQEKIENINPEDGTLWSLGKLLRKRRGGIGALRSENNLAETDIDKAEIFADALHAIADDVLADHAEHRNILRKLNADRNRPGMEIPPATFEEVKTIISNLNRKKAPGIDGISNTAIICMPKNAVLGLTEIINLTITTRQFPSNWKLANVIMIHKKGKPKSDPNSYRPISLLSSLSKICEKIILNRLNVEIEDFDILPGEQFGFRHSHGTELQLLRLVEEIHQVLDDRDSAIGVFLDISRAFDRVWHEGLIAKLYYYNINPYLINIIESYLNNRRFVVSVGDTKSTQRALRAGVAQGSVISPTLYNLYTADFPKSSATSLYAYADDIAILSTSRSEKLAHCKLQSALKEASVYFKKWKLKPHPDKSVHVIFSNKLHPYDKTLKINGKNIPMSDSVKYLGVIIDRKLTWAKHINYAAKKGSQAIAMLYPLICANSKLSLNNKLLLYRQIVRPITTYGSIVWSTAAKTHLNKIQITQNKFLRISTNAPFASNMARLQDELAIDPISKYLNTLNTKKLNKASTHENPLIPQALNYNPILKTRRNRPKTLLLHPPIT